MARIDAQIDAVFADIDGSRQPGAALLVIDHDEILCAKGYGLADVEAGRPITTDTSFYLASLSKQFTGMAIMQLAEQGKLSFEDPLPEYFPEFPRWGSGITLRHMLHHTSGLPHYTQFFSSSDDIPQFSRDVAGVTNEAVLERTMALPAPEFPAGAQYAYGGIGYTLLAMIVEIVSGQSFADFLKANIFDPIGMKHTVAYDESRPARHRLAHGYWRENDRFERWDYPMFTVGDGGLFSTLDDLFLWDRALDSERLVSRSMMKHAFTSGRTNDGTLVNYGFGWITNVFPYLSDAERAQLHAIGGSTLSHVAHGGTWPTYFNYIIRLLDQRRTIIVLSNRGPIAPARAPAGHTGFDGPRVRAHRVAEIVFGA